MSTGKHATSVQVAVYKGDECIVVGSLNECTEALQIKPDSLYYYLMPAYERRVAKRKFHRDGPREVVRI